MRKSFSIIVFLVVSMHVFGQNETTSLGIGYNFIKDQPSFDFQFNRKSASKAKDSYDIAIIKNYFVLNPAVEAHLGPGTETSENNVVVNIRSYFKRNFERPSEKKFTSLYKINFISPTIATDKDFEVYQLFGTLGFEYNSYYLRADKGYFEYSIGVDYDQGVSSIDSTSQSENVNRIRLRPTFMWQFAGKRSDPDSEAPVETDPDFYFKFDLSVAYTYYNFIEQDERVIADKHFGYLNIIFGWRLSKSLKLSLEYKQGMVEPKYKELNALTFGVSLVK